MNNELSLLGKKQILNKTVDTLLLARDKYPGSSVSLDALCKRYNIDNSKREKHTALIDCELLAKVYINLTDQKEPKLDFGANTQKINYEHQGNKFYYKRVVKPNEIESQNHKEYLKNYLKKNFY